MRHPLVLTGVPYLSLDLGLIGEEGNLVSKLYPYSHRKALICAAHVAKEEV
jgi:hypothetical protein